MSPNPTAAILALALCFSVPPAMSQDIAEPRADIRATYDFDPSRMTFDEQASRAPDLSELWARFEKSPERYREALRAELLAEGNREILYCDGGMLLLVNSSSSADDELGLASLRKCSLAEIEYTPYFFTLHSIAMRGIDTFDYQARILAKPDYSVFIVPHVLTLRQNYAFLYPFLVQQESAYVARLVALLGSASDGTAQRSIVRALWYAATPAAEAAVRAAAEDRRLAEQARADARKILKDLSTIRGWQEGDTTLERIRNEIGATAATTENELRAKRRARMRSVSDEALGELDLYTALIYRLTGSVARESMPSP